MSDTAQGPGWWQASDGRWYPPELHPSAQAAASGTAAGTVPPPLPAAAEPPLPSFWDGAPGTAAHQRPGLRPLDPEFTASAYGTGVLASAPRPARHRRVALPVFALVFVVGLAAVLVLLFSRAPAGPDQYRSPTAVAEDYLRKLYGGNPPAAGADIAPGQNTNIIGAPNETLTIEVQGVTRSAARARVSLLVCFNLASGRCTPNSPNALEGQLDTLRVGRNWYVDERAFPACDTAGPALVCAG